MLFMQEVLNLSVVRAALSYLQYMLEFSAAVTFKSFEPQRNAY